MWMWRRDVGLVCSTGASINLLQTDAGERRSGGGDLRFEIRN